MFTNRKNRMSTPIRHTKTFQSQRSFQPYGQISRQSSLIFPVVNQNTPLLTSPTTPTNQLLSSNLLLHQLQQQQQEIQNKIMSERLAKLVQEESRKLAQDSLQTPIQSQIPIIPSLPPPASSLSFPKMLEDASKLMPTVKDPFMLGYITGLLYASNNSNTNQTSNPTVENLLVSRASSLPNMIQFMMGNGLIETPPETEIVQMPILHPETTRV